MAFQHTTGDYTLFSPGGRPCLTVEGDAQGIIDAGLRYSQLGRLMERAAVELDKIASGDESYRALALDEIRESAGTAARDLEKVARRYGSSDDSVGTGRALTEYGRALRRVQELVTADLVRSISAADAQAGRARSSLDSARGALDDVETTRFWEDEASDSEKQAAETEVEEAEGALRAAERELEGLWTAFDGAVGDWEESYDTAVSRIETALDVSDIDDSRWDDFLDGLASFAGFAGLVLAVAAIIVGAPWIIAAAVVAGLVVLAAQTVLYLNGSGRVSGLELGLSALAVLPFGKAFTTARLGGSGWGAAGRSALGLGDDSSRAIASGRNAIERDLRTWSSRASTSAAAGNRASRTATAGALADDLVAQSGQRSLAQMWAAVRSGGTAADTQAMRLSEQLRAGQWAAGGTAGQRSMSWANSAGVSRGDQGLNVVNAGVTAWQAPETVSSVADRAGRAD